MMSTAPEYPTCCPGVTRRSFLADTGMGFTGLALAAMLYRDGVARAGTTKPDGKPNFPPRAKSVIWIFLCGGVSHVESFDPKPALNKYSGKTIESTPYKGVLKTEGKDVVAGNPARGRSRPSARGSATGSGRSTRTCPSTSCSARPPATAAGVAGRTGPA